MDVWLRMVGDEVDAEANTRVNDAGQYVVDWYLTSVGLVKSVAFDTLADAYDWLEAEGFEDYTVN